MDNELNGPGTRRARFVVSYLGTGFHGFAANAGVRTVMGDLGSAMSTVLRRPVDLTGAGRTDAGVHAWGQVVSGDLPSDIDLAGLRRRLNKLCAPDIAVRSADWAAPTFDARFSATSRSYRYHVWNDPAPNPLMAATTWHVPRPLQVERMRQALPALVGEHDFSSFCRRPRPVPGADAPSMVRIIHLADWICVDDSPLLRFSITGSAFCHQMVRSIVGTVVDIGTGRLDPRTMVDILAAHDRAAAGTVAPPAGLTLWEVGYEGVRWDAPDD
ncbi:MAG: tRNA pseudouridine(38-40) synthase TruA [Ilumatobacteraceae bacterium]